MPAGPVVAAVGPATAAALEKHGLACHLVPDEYVAEGLLDAFEEQAAPVAGARVLIPCARDARDVLPETLRERGAVVDVLHIYDTVAAGELAVPAAQVEAADYITFTSASTAKRLAALLTAGGQVAGAGEAARGAARRRPALLHRPDHQPDAARPRPDRGRRGPGVHRRGPRRGDRRRRAGAMSAVTIYGVCAVSFMMVMYALEPRGRGFVLAFAAGCLLSSAYGFLSGAWPFGVVEAVWAVGRRAPLPQRSGLSRLAARAGAIQPASLPRRACSLAGAVSAARRRRASSRRVPATTASATSTIAASAARRGHGEGSGGGQRHGAVEPVVSGERCVDPGRREDRARRRGGPGRARSWRRAAPPPSASRRGALGDGGLRRGARRCGAGTHRRRRRADTEQDRRRQRDQDRRGDGPLAGSKAGVLEHDGSLHHETTWSFRDRVTRPRGGRRRGSRSSPADLHARGLRSGRPESDGEEGEGERAAGGDDEDGDHAGRGERGAVSVGDVRRPGDGGAGDDEHGERHGGEQRWRASSGCCGTCGDCELPWCLPFRVVVVAGL